MKQIILILVLSILSQCCLVAKPTPLPVEPWRAISFMEKYSSASRWEGEVSLKLMGKYTIGDSLMAQNAIVTLNALCETVNLNFSDCDRGDIEFYFVDSTNVDDYTNIVDVTKTDYPWRFSYSHRRYTHVSCGVQLELVADGSRQYFLTNQLIFALYPKRLPIEYIHKKGRPVSEFPNSVFAKNTLDYVPPFKLEPSEFDRLLIKTVYASNYGILLPQAKHQFYQLPHWVNSNAKKILVFPFLLLFLLVGLSILFYNRIGRRIQNLLLRFNVVAVLSLFLLGGLGALFIISSDKLENPFFSFYRWYDVILGMLVFTVFGLIAANIIRFLEKGVHKRAHHKYSKFIILFLSTSFIPFLAISAVYVFSPYELQEHDKELLSILFLVFTLIGLIRALISFFILKEEEIRIENEVKLAR